MDVDHGLGFVDGVSAPLRSSDLVLSGIHNQTLRPLLSQLFHCFNYLCF